MAAIELRGVTRRYGAKPALDDVSLAVRPESFTVLCGPPRAGKSVLFRLLVGLEAPDAGSILLEGQDITRAPAAARPIGYVPQSFALYPHLTVHDNIAYALTLQRAPKREIESRVEQAAGLLSITHLLKKTPDQLSGGEKQRTALARGLLKNAKLFILDDPLVGLDYKLRERLMDELKGLRESLGATFLYATSDSLEALTVAQDLVVMDAGRLIQQGEVVDLYHAPSHLRSLELVGFPKANVVDGHAGPDGIEAGPFRFSAARPPRQGPIKIGIRPEALQLGQGRGIDGRGRVTLVENLGGELIVYLDAGGTPLTIGFPFAGGAEPGLDDEVAFSVDPTDIMLFDPSSGVRLTQEG